MKQTDYRILMAGHGENEMKDWKLIKMPNGEWYKAYYAGPSYGWISETGNYLGDENPGSVKSTPLKILDFCVLDAL